MGNGKTERFNRTLLDMLGCLTEDQKKNWKKYVSTVVHAYNSQRHESTGFSPFFLMFGRHPRLAVDVGLNLTTPEATTDFTQDLQNRLGVAYDLAISNARKSAGRQKENYDKKVRGATVSVGDRVLVRNVGLKGKHKLANIWEDYIYEVLEQPNDDIPVYVVQKEGSRSKKTLHRNMLFHVLPLDDPQTPRSTK